MLKFFNVLNIRTLRNYFKNYKIKNYKIRKKMSVVRRTKYSIP